MIRSYINGRIIKKLRNDKGVTQEDVARVTGLSQAHIAKIENEQVDPRLSTVNKILKALSKSNRKLEGIVTREIISIDPNDKIRKASKLMRKYDISQLPVIDHGEMVGSITESGIVRNLEKGIGDKKVKGIMEGPFPTINEKEGIETVKVLLEHNPAVIVKGKEGILGIITKSDLLTVCF